MPITIASVEARRRGRPASARPRSSPGRERHDATSVTAPITSRIAPAPSSHRRAASCSAVAESVTGTRIRSANGLLQPAGEVEQERGQLQSCRRASMARDLALAQPTCSPDARTPSPARWRPPQRRRPGNTGRASSCSSSPNSATGHGDRRELAHDRRSSAGRRSVRSRTQSTRRPAVLSRSAQARCRSPKRRGRAATLHRVLIRASYARQSRGLDSPSLAGRDA